MPTVTPEIGAAPARRDAPETDYPKLLQKVERVLDGLEPAADLAGTIRAAADQTVGAFRAELGLSGGRIYERQDDEYVLCGTFGEARLPAGETRIPATYAPVELCLRDGVVYMTAADPRLDPRLETQLGARDFAALHLADQSFILSFDVAPGLAADAVYFSLGLLRWTLNQKLRREHSPAFEEARFIQAAVLPPRPLRFDELEIAGRSVPMETFGGDFFDYFRITERTAAVAVADVAGHGLPAALLVRDVAMGLRMGSVRRFMATRTLEYLNDIIHQSRLTSRFVSLFYGHLRRNGDLIYVNAGHPPAIHLAADGSATLLGPTGPVVGPLPRATYASGSARLGPGDRLVLYTDGVSEAPRKDDGEELGIERLIECVRSANGSAAETAASVCACLAEWTGGAPVHDDRTVLVVGRLG